MTGRIAMQTCANARWWTALLLLIFWPGALLSQRSMFFELNRTAASGTLATVAASLGCTNDNYGSSANIACTTASISAGQDLLVFIATGQNVAISSVADSNTGTVANVLGGSGGTVDNSVTLWTYDVVGTAAGTHTITATWTSTVNYLAIIVMVINSPHPTSPIDSANAVGITSATTTLQCGSVTTTEAGELLVSTIAAGSDTISSAGTVPQAMTMYENTFSSTFATEYGNAVTTGTNYGEFIDSATGDAGPCHTLAIH
jgi:hypothetical protein